MPPTARWLRRRQTGAAALLLYTLLAVAMMAPLAPDVLPFTGAQDIGNHVSGIIEAKNALAEGQFPIRVAPHQNHNERYAIYQFYGNLPYTVGGPRARWRRRGLRVGAGYGLGLVLSAWYVAPQQTLLPHMCEGLAPPVGHVAWLTPLGVLLAPSVALPDHLGTIYIACQEHFG